MTGVKDSNSVRLLIPMSLLLVLFIWSFPLAAVNITLEWDPNDVEDEVIGYKVFCKEDWEEEYNYEYPEWVGPTTTCTITIIDGNRYNFVVRAYRDGAESGDSNEVTYPDDLPDDDDDGGGGGSSGCFLGAAFGNYGKYGVVGELFSALIKSKEAGNRGPVLKVSRPAQKNLSF